MESYQFTNDWFDTGTRRVWDHIIPQLNPRKVLEIGSYEGASACYLIDRLAAESEMEIHCVDTWEGGIEHRAEGSAQIDMSQVEDRFISNTSLSIRNAKHRVSLFVHKMHSYECLAALVCDGKKNYFDFIYVDGSHQAPDVLCDAVLGFKLLKVGGFMAFDDYLWSERLPYGTDPLRCPKPAVDAFINLNIRKLTLYPASMYQIYVQKVAE